VTICNLIADDLGVVHQGLHMFLGVEPGLEVVVEPANGAEAVQQACQLQPDVVLMDGIAASATIGRDLPDTEVLTITSVLVDTSAVEANQADAIGSLFKGTDACALYHAIKAARGYN
jgi:two-component system, NarL family, response regulator LiaR